MTATPPLILLAAGRKVRPRRAPVVRPKEITLHMSVAKVLRDHCLPEWQWFHPGSGELRDIKTAVKLKRMGLKAGLPDIALIGPTGIFHALELKRRGETLSDAQEAFQLWCIRHGVPHSVAYSFDDALAALDAWGCLRIKIGGSP
jgi:VRR-NUC domain